jgi:hypothetical protein
MPAQTKLALVSNRTGAFIASAAAALGGRLRDDNEGALDLRS